MAINSVTRQSLTDADISSRYGFGLLNALNTECRASGYTWQDSRRTSASWDRIQANLRPDTPVIIGVGYPFSSGPGRGTSSPSWRWTATG